MWNGNLRQDDTLWVVCLATGVDAADKALLPAVFKALGGEMGVGAAELGQLVFAQSIAFALALPFWGAALQNYEARILLACGCFGWGTSTALCAFTGSFLKQMFLRMVNGAFLAAILPIGQAILCNLVQEDRRGRWFGYSQACGAVATMAISYYATANQAAWRHVHLQVSVVSFMLGVLVLRLPREKVHASEAKTALDYVRAAGKIFKIPSFNLLVLQGVVGGIPWNSMSFLALYWQEIGYSARIAGTLTAAGHGASAFGAVAGGFLGDAAARQSDRGRIYVAISSVLLGGLAYYSLFAVQPAPFTTSLAIIMLFSVVAVWTPAAANRPICAQLAPSPEERGQIVALWVMVEGVSSACFGAPLVGRMSELFGYRLQAGSGSTNNASAAGLAKAIIGVSMTAWAICAFFWVIMMCTLPGDVERAKEQYQQRLRSADIAEPEEARAVLPKEQSESMQLGEVSPVGQRHRTSHTL